MRYFYAFLTILSLAFIFIDGLSALVLQWLRLDELWKFLIIPVSLIFAWNKRKELSIAAPHPSLYSGFFLIGIGSVTYLLWKISFIDLCDELGLFFLSVGYISLLLGNNYTKIFLLPLGYLVLMTSLIERILSPVVLGMQYGSAMITAFFLNAAGREVLRDGLFLRLPHAVLEVAQECSGIGQLTALIAFVIPLGILMHKSIWPRLVLILATIPVALLVNAIRIILIALWNYNSLKSSIHGPHEILRMPSIFPLALILLFLFSMALAHGARKKAPRSIQPALSPKENFRPSTIRFAWFFGFFLMVITVFSVFFFRVRPVQYSHDIQDFPMRLDSWTGENFPDSDFTFYMGKPDATLQRKYTNEHGAAVGIFIARFDCQNVRKRISSLESDIFKKESKPINIPLNNTASIRALFTQATDNKPEAVTVSWFDVDGTICVSLGDARQKFIGNTFKRRHNNAAFIAITEANANGLKFEALPLIAAFFFPAIKIALETNRAE